MAEKPAYIDNKHFTEYSMKALRLKKEKKYDSAISLLLKIIDATEEESKYYQMGVAPAYYEELANIYKKLKLFDEERNILIRFSRQIHAPGMKPAKIIERLNKLDT